MEIKHSTEDDFLRIMEIYSYARKFMKESGNPNQWGPTNWPPEDLIHNDIKIGKSYVCIHNDKIVGTFYYDFGKDIEPTYKIIEKGNWKNDNPYGVVHRIAGDGSVKGIGAYCINWAFDQSKHLRIDTHDDNKVMQNLLKKLNFQYCGIIHIIKDNYPRLAYEKF